MQSGGNLTLLCPNHFTDLNCASSTELNMSSGQIDAESTFIPELPKLGNVTEQAPGIQPKMDAPCRGEVGEDEEHVAAGADDERALGSQPRHHRRRDHGEDREGGVEDPQRDRAQVALLHDEKTDEMKRKRGGQKREGKAEQRVRGCVDCVPC